MCLAKEVKDLFKLKVNLGKFNQIGVWISLLIQAFVIFIFPSISLSWISDFVYDHITVFYDKAPHFK